MNKGISLSALAAQIEAQMKSKRDFIADTPTITMADDGKTLALEGAGDFGIQETAHDQIGARLQIPAKYYDRMREEAPDLLAANVNRWFKQNPEKRMVRTLEGNARAFLSNRYQRIDNHEIAHVALPILLSIPDIQVLSCQITESRMYIQATTPRVKGEVAVGDVVQAGLIIQNSEIGMGSVSIQTLAYRLRCLNGMVLPDGSFKAYHVGRKVEDTSELWADDTKQADDRAVLLKVRDMVSAAVNEERFAGHVNRMKALTDQRVTGDPAKVVELVAKTIDATEGERGGLLRALIEGGDLSAWGIVNAVTAQAHTVESYDRSVEFEAAGGKLLNLPANDWHRILQAA